MAFRVCEYGFEIGVSYKPRFCSGRLFDKSALAIIDGYFISLFGVRKAGADLGGDEKYLVWYFTPFRADEYVRTVIFLRMQPKIVGGGFAQKPVVLNVVPSRKNTEFSHGKDAEGDNGRIFYLFLFGWQNSRIAQFLFYFRQIQRIFRAG